MKRALPYLAVAAVVGCSGATTAFTRTGPTLAAQPDSCEFSVVTTAPNDAATQLGTIDIKYLKQTDWIYNESAFKRKIRMDVCKSGGDTVIAHINDNGLYVSATVLTTKGAQVAAPSPAAASSEAEATAEATAPASPPAAATTTAPEKSSPSAATPAKKEEPAKDDDPTKAANGKKRNKKGATVKKDDDIHGKDGKVDIDKLL